MTVLWILKYAEAISFIMAKVEMGKKYTFENVKHNNLLFDMNIFLPFGYTMAKKFHICKWISFPISTFAIIEETASAPDSQHKYLSINTWE